MTGPVLPVADLLLVVDVQRALVTGPDAVPDAAGLLARLDALLDRARASGTAVVHLQNDGPAGASDEPGTSGWELVLEPRDGEPVIRKTVDDPFAGTDLARVLAERPVQVAVVVGVQSEMCVAAAARGLMARGLSVVLPRDAHATCPAPEDGPSAPPVPAALVARVAEWSLGDGVVAPDRAADVRFAERES